jgi:hypothetical protein
MTQSEADLRKEFEERLRFETLLADLSTRFVSVPAGQVDREIEDAQRRVCELDWIYLRSGRGLSYPRTSSRSPISIAAWTALSPQRRWGQVSISPGPSSSSWPARW